MFTLEVLDATHGDALLLHHGNTKSPDLIVIDGGPPAVYDLRLKDRLEAIREQRSPDKPLPIQLLMISHIDDDHIGGVLAMFRDMEQQLATGLPYAIRSIWHNSFNDLTGAGAVPAALQTAALASAGGNPPPGFTNMEQGPALVLASVGQGQQVRDLAKKLGIKNVEFGKELVALPKSGVTRKTFGKLTLTILGPLENRVEKLRKEWAKAVAKQDAKAAAKLAATDKLDHSPFNLASIVVLAEADGKRLLLTGDARCDDILAGLEAADLLDDDGKIEVDVLKLPHHGSVRNANREFFDRVRAKEYVVSADGRHDNPDLETFEHLTASRGQDPYKVHVTNEMHVKTGGINPSCAFLKKEAKSAKFKVVFRKPSEPSLSVPIGGKSE